MKRFEQPEMEITKITVEDVITTSNGGSSAEGGAGDWE